MENKKPSLFVNPAPHISHSDTVPKIMWIVFASLIPAAIWSVFYFGLPALYVILTAILSCLATESLFNFIRKSPLTIQDGSAAVTGILFAFSLPPYVPLYIPAIGSIFAIAVVKQIFGGLGYNVMNPALAARVFVMFAWIGPMTAVDSYIPRMEESFYYQHMKEKQVQLDAISHATPLMSLKNFISGKESNPIPYIHQNQKKSTTVPEWISFSVMENGILPYLKTNQEKENFLSFYQKDEGKQIYFLKPDIPDEKKEQLSLMYLFIMENRQTAISSSIDYITDIFIGRAAGSLGEISALFLILGGLWLLKRRYILYHIPLAFLSTLGFLTFIYAWIKGIVIVPEYSGLKNALLFVYLHIFSGGAILGAFYMMTDMVTTPLSVKGQVIMAIGAGFLTVLIRLFGGYPEGVMFAILLMELVVPFIDQMSKPKIYGWDNKQ